MEVMPVGKQNSTLIHPGSTFIVPLIDGTFAVAQIVDWMTPVSARCFLFDVQVKNILEIPSTLPQDQAACKCIVLRAHLDNGKWQVGPLLPVCIPSSDWPFEDTRSRGWVGASVISPLVLEDIANAWFGLKFWDDWFDRQYLDKFLLSPSLRPSRAIYKHRSSTPH